jgi:NADH:ubiquinone oxidoreductase subunit E
MKTITVCVGSACHLRGAYNIIDIFQRLIETSQVSDSVTLKGSFCLGKCSKGVSVKIDDSEIMSVSTDCAEDFFKKFVLGEQKNEYNELFCS